MKLFIYFTLFLASFCGFSKDLLVGVITGVPPFSEISDNAGQTYLYGFSIDIMNNICKLLHKNCIFTPLTLSNQFAQLDEGKIDVLLLPIPYQLDHLSSYAVSLPYLLSKVRFVADKNSTLQKGTSITNLKIGVMKATFFNLISNSPYKNDNTIIPFDNLPDLITNLVDHKVDVIVLNSAIAYYYINNHTYDKEIKFGDGYGMIARPENVELIQQINKAILSMQTDGSYVAIYNKYYESE